MDPYDRVQLQPQIPSEPVVVPNDPARIQSVRLVKLLGCGTHFVLNKRISERDCCSIRDITAREVIPTSEWASVPVDCFPRSLQKTSSLGVA